MKSIKLKNLHRVLVLVTLSLTACLSVAQYGGGMGGGAGGRRGGMQSNQRPPSNEAQNLCTLGQINADAVPFDLVDSRLMMLEADLQPTKEQQPLWQDLTKHIRAYAIEIDRQHSSRNRDNATSYQAVDGIKYITLAVDRSRNRYTLLENVETSFKRLYKTLTPSQKTLVDMRVSSIVAPQFPNPKCQQLAY